MNAIENAPALELDKILYKDHPMPSHVRRERRIVWNLLKHLYSIGGWSAVKVYDGDEFIKVDDAHAALEIIFNLDDAYLYVGRNGQDAHRKHRIKLVLGNDLDIISDWNYTEGDPDGFNAAMEKFDAEVYA